MTLGERIKELRTSLNLSQQELADRLNVAKQTVYKYENGIVTNIPSDKIETMATLFNVSPQYLMGWDTVTPSPDFSELYEKYPNIKPITKQKIPMLGKIACGEPTYADEEHETYIEINSDLNADFCLTCSGDSMINANILDGDIVFIRSQSSVDDGQIAAVIIEDEATLKRVYFDKAAGVLQLVAENPKYRPLVYSGPDLDHIRIIGKAVSLYRRIKQ